MTVLPQKQYLKKSNSEGGQYDSAAIDEDACSSIDTWNAVQILKTLFQIF